MTLNSKFSSDHKSGVLGEPDDPDLWTKILHHIPDKLLLDTMPRILVIGCGHATEAVLLVKRMLSLNLNPQDVNESFYLIDKSKMYTRYVSKTYGFKNVYTADFMTWNTDMKFDIIIANPPYKKLSDNGQQTSLSIWKDFIVKSSKMLSVGGYMLYVTPTGWCSPSDNGKLIERVFSQLNLVYADISDSVKSHFKGVGSTFGYTITVNEPYSHNTRIKTNDGIHVVDLTKTRLITKDGMSIIKKLTMSAHPRCRFKVFGKTQQYPAPGYHTNDKPNIAIYKNIHNVNSSKDYLPDTTIPVRWSIHPSALTKYKKVVIPRNGPVNVIVDKGEFGVGVECTTMLLDDNELIESAAQVFNSKLFRFFASQRSTQYNEPSNLNQFPLLDLTRPWTDAELYSHFKFSAEEIAFIEEFVPKKR